MTIIYWGPVDSGKHHLREYAKANLKTWTKWEQFSATKYSYTDIMTREIFTNEDDTYVSTHEMQTMVMYIKCKIMVKINYQIV